MTSVRNPPNRWLPAKSVRPGDLALDASGWRPVRAIRQRHDADGALEAVTLQYPAGCRYYHAEAPVAVKRFPGE